MEEQATKKKRNSKTGRVISNRMDKSVVVAVDRLVKHPLYRKTIRRTSRFMAHDEQNGCSIGDKVLIEECRPLSRRKRWVVKEVLEKVQE